MPSDLIDINKRLASSFAQRATFWTLLGVPVIPVQPRSKACTLTAWPEKATTNETQIARWNKENPDYNVAAVAKPHLGCTFDGDHDSIIERIRRETGKELPSTLTSQGSKPFPLGHYHFLQTDYSRRLGNRELNLKDDNGRDVVDSRGKKTRLFDFQQNNKYVVEAGSIHPDGYLYRIVNNVSRVPIPDWFCEWMERVTGAVPHSQPATDSSSPTSTVAQVAARILTRDLSNNTEDANRLLSQSMGFAHRHQADEKFAIWLVRDSGFGSAERCEKFESYKLHEDRSGQYTAKTLEKAEKFVADKQPKNPGAIEIDPDSWREGCKTFGQLSTELPRFLLSGLVPEKAFTAICAASYNCKTWLALMMALAISTGQDLWEFPGPVAPVPCIYHVPEMNEALVRQYMATLGFQESENFLVRPMESGLWSLDDPRMLRSSEGRMVFLDTAGYFNPADDSSSYQQSLKFAKLLYNLLENGAIAIAGLFHPPKSASQENQNWTLENSILGSAGYGGMLRSCLRMKNLNPDLNDENVWIYVQGMKNPGLKPFQLKGPPPLTLKVSPGASPYLKDLDISVIDPRRERAFEGFKEKKPHKVLSKELSASFRELTKWRAEYTALGDAPADEPFEEDKQLDIPEGE
jgi:hypothetical protein